MRVVFVDTVYWIATINPRDSLHRAPSDLRGGLGQHRLVTSQMVLVEVLNAMSADGSLRRAAADVAQEIVADPTIDLVPQTSELFRDALALYGERPDKSWSLTDCASFLIMDAQQIT